MNPLTGQSNIVSAAVALAALMFGAPVAVAQTYSSGPPGSPSIVLPDRLVSSGQQADAAIDIKFVTTPDTTVDLTSLHIWWHRALGWMDVTDRLRSHPQVHVSLSGIHLDAGVLPAGAHEVRLIFHDMKGRILDATETIRILEARAPI